MSRNDRSDSHDGSVLVVTVATGERPHQDGPTPTHEHPGTGVDPGVAVLALPDLEELHRTFTPKSLELLDAAHSERPASITEAARTVDRDVKNVHTELRRLEELGVVSFVDEGRANRPVVRFDEVRIRIGFDGPPDAPAEASGAGRRLDAPEEIYSRITDAFVALDDAARVTYLNERAEELLERSREELIGSVLWRAFPEALGTVFEARYREAVRTGEPVAHETYYPPLDAWLVVRAYPSETGLTVYFRDVTDRKRSERRHDELAAVNHLNRVVRETSHSVSSWPRANGWNGRSVSGWWTRIRSRSRGRGR
jgi:PAS domain S-box-containing protein